ncbi:MAG: F0F1 ATP synthase subunit B [Actinomycetaceae bacterium]|nr:F0F1 ATP synthase subunit B [Actinomycetaceae bacterium]
MQIMTALLAVAETPNPLLPAVYDIVWSLITLVVVAFILVKFALPKFTALADERSYKIEQGLADAEEAKAAKALAKTRSEQEITEARKEAQAIREEAKAEGLAIVERARAEAKAESERIQEQAEREILAKQQAAALSLRSDVGMLAAELAEKIVGEQLRDHELSARVIDRFLDELEVSTKEK